MAAAGNTASESYSTRLQDCIRKNATAFSAFLLGQYTMSQTSGCSGTGSVGTGTINEARGMIKTLDRKTGVEQGFSAVAIPPRELRIIV